MDEHINSLVYTWREKGKFGLTLPFIIGALRLKGLVHGSATESCSFVLKQLQTAGVNFRLGYCDKADDLILAPVNNSPSGCDRVSDNGKPTSLWVQHDLVTGEGAESTDLFRVLCERYGSYLEAERYSCIKGEYHPFSAEDLALIEEAFVKIA